jgi:hypothetical protein
LTVTLGLRAARTAQRNEAQRADQCGCLPALNAGGFADGGPKGEAEGRVTDPVRAAPSASESVRRSAD